MTLPTGDWRINANGFPGTLHIGSVDASGNLVESTVFGQPILGFWDDVSNKITFLRIVDTADPSTHQIYTGYLFPADASSPTTAQRLAGSFEAFAGTGGTAQRVLYGWFARI